MDRQWLPLIRAAYHLSDNTESWLRELANASVRVMDRGAGVIAFRYIHDENDEFHPAEIVYSSCEDTARFEGFRNFLLNMPSEWHPERPKAPSIHHTVSEKILSSAEFEEALSKPVADSLREQLAGSDFIDALVTRVEFDDDDGGVMFVAPSETRLDPPLIERARWASIAQHIRAGWKLSERLEDGVNRSAMHEDGAFEHEETTQLFPMLETVERDHEEERRPNKELWTNLLDGAFSIVDRYTETLRARHYILLSNQPQLVKSRRLKSRERRAVIEFVRTASGSDVAVELDVAESTVRQYLRSAMLKLGVQHRSELLQIAFATGFLRRKTTGHELRPPDRPSHHSTVRRVDDDLSVLSIPLVPSSLVLRHLTNAECEICRYVMLGWSTDQIARQRETSERTVANQLASIFRKLDITDRYELTNRLLGAKEDGSHIAEGAIMTE
jgi:DNA-binding NarL/FixJ family response regulator